MLSALWILAVIIVNPYGHFPLNDDWSYGQTVKRLVEEGSFRPTGWTTMPLLTHTLWGALFCLPDGFSFTALRFSTLWLALTGILGTYLLLKQVGDSRYLAVTGALVMAANPIYFALSHTFMTDVPFATFTVFATLFLIRRLQVESNFYLVLGTLFASGAILCRQLGLVVPIAFAFVFLLKHGFSRSTLMRAAAPLLAGWSALWGFEYWLKTSVGLPSLYNFKIERLLEKLLGNPGTLLLAVSGNLLKILIYLGLFLLPLVLLLFCMPGWFRFIRSRVLFIILAITASLVVCEAKQPMPLARNVLTSGGIGPVTLRDVYILELPHAPILPAAFWWAITVLGIVGGGMIVVYIFSVTAALFGSSDGLKSNNDRFLLTFLLSACLIYCLPIVISGFFDRYLLPLAPLLAAVLAISMRTLQSRPQPIWTTLALLLICLYASFSIAATHDYLAWNRTRWVALQTLMTNDHLPPAEIDGGFEFNGWYLYYADYVPDPSKSWWWVHNDRYLVTMGPVAGYELVRQYSFQRWLPPEPGYIFILRRESR
ncbi:MAG: glycosyltransferase family 39 protein [Anaerolineae bacterium]|nr:glycosyltransferase family 39 protein [Anaerolineae bacterium]